MINTILFLLIGGIVGYIYGSKKAHEEKCRRRKDLLDRMVKISQESGLYTEKPEDISRKCLTKK